MKLMLDHDRHLTARLGCPLEPKRTPDKPKPLKRWNREDVLDRMQAMRA